MGEEWVHEEDVTGAVARESLLHFLFREWGEEGDKEKEPGGKLVHLGRAAGNNGLGPGGGRRTGQ